MMDDIRLAKKKMRHAIKAMLFGVSKEEAASASRSVLEALLNLEQWKNSDTLLAFVSMKDELDTSIILQKALEMGKKLYVPRVEGSDLVFCRITDLSAELTPGAFGILEPVQGLPMLDVETFSGQSAVALVPGVAFDREKYRLGRGKGFYDRFFAHAGDSLYKIGIGYSFQLVDRVPRENHDRKLDFIVSP